MPCTGGFTSPFNWRLLVGLSTVLLLAALAGVMLWLCRPRLSGFQWLRPYEVCRGILSCDYVGLRWQYMQASGAEQARRAVWSWACSS